MSLKIVVLDGFCLNPGDLDWSPLKALGELSIYDRTPAELVLQRAQGADVLLTNKTVLGAQQLAALPGLKYVGILATGTNVVDLQAAGDLGITVTNVPGYGPDAVAQMVFAHLLYHTQQVAQHHQAVVAGAWSQCADFCFTLSPLMSLSGKVMGIVGYGDIGSRVANIARAMGMRVLLHTRTERHDLAEGISWAPLEQLYREADVISLHCPLTAATEKMINQDSLQLLKPGVILINTARGGLVDENALATALNQGKLRAGVDVLSSEPPMPDNPLLKAKGVSISPHNAWATREARQKLLDIAVDNLRAFIGGDSVNQV
ncbi:D-2-hydroxyacid dehydrogenase [Shewanella chilikensis]|uniref:D-2-hydroxyacid dehydrogenase n=1 Tax=Shewanella chilikensis TaxID=558541 RepID=UPI001CD64F36|nr:D-2-hydroxyacid dehydrogenase [Shewanella chilikensis]MCA0951705.1 D-2-hydroxyacid dehydrogenase [Shewanella chilikensis]